MTTEARADTEDEQDSADDEQPETIIHAATTEVLTLYLGCPTTYEELPGRNLDQLEAMVIQVLLSRNIPKAAERIAKERQQATPDPNRSIGMKTLDQLPEGEALPQLHPPFLSPEGTTVIYGPGNVGKGMLSVHFALELTKADKSLHIMVIDYEHHEHEWGRRARAMGATDDQLKRIHYRAPFADEWTAPRGALVDVAAYIRADCDRLNISFLIIDSYTTATSTGDSMGGKDAAQEFYAGVRTIGRPNLVIAHVASGGDKWPKKPFGSVFVHNLARETWAAENVPAEDIEFDPKTNEYQPTVLALELRNMKMNNGPRPANQYISFSFDATGNIDVSYVQKKKKSIGEMATDVLARGKKPMTTAAIVKAILEAFEEKVEDASLRAALRRNKAVIRDPDDDSKWKLANAPTNGDDDEETAAR